MREPTPRAQLYAWHAAALKVIARYGDWKRVPRDGKTGIPEYDDLGRFDDDEVQCGWYKRRLVRGGPWVAVEIWMHQEVLDRELIAPEYPRCEVDGREVDPVDQWTYVMTHPITEKEFRFLRAEAAWVKANAPDEPQANPNRPVDLVAVPIPY